jgi:hypothetical protein
MTRAKPAREAAPSRPAKPTKRPKLEIPEPADAAEQEPVVAATPAVRATPAKLRCRSCGRFLGAGASGELCADCDARVRAEAAIAMPIEVEWPRPATDSDREALLPPLEPPQAQRTIALYAEEGIVIPRPSQLHGEGPGPEPGTARQGPQWSLRTAPVRRAAPARTREATPDRPTRRLSTEVKVAIAMGILVGILVGVVVPFLVSR